MINRFGRSLAAATVVAAAGLIAAGCSSSSGSSTSGSTPGGSATNSGSTSNLSSVTLNIGDQKGTGAQAILKAAGLLSTLPFKVSWSDFTSGPPMLQAMASGSVDIGGVGEAPPVFAAAGNEPLVMVGARQTLPNGSGSGDADAVVVPKNSPITSISQLRGKKIAVAQGSSGDYNVLTVLSKAGLTPKDVSLDYLQPAVGLAALTSGHVDAWDVWPPYVQQVVAQNNARVLATGSAYGSPYSFEVASKAAIADPAKAAAIRVYLTTLDKAYAWSATHVAAWAQVWGQATGLPNAVMLTAAKADEQQGVPITSAVIASEQQVVNAFYTAGLIPNKVNITDYMSASFNSTVGG